MLKPHLWIVDGKWRGEIGFDDAKTWNRWFDSYEKWMLHYADLAEAECDESAGLSRWFRWQLARTIEYPAKEKCTSWKSPA